LIELANFIKLPNGEDAGPIGRYFFLDKEIRWGPAARKPDPEIQINAEPIKLSKK